MKPISGLLRFERVIALLWLATLFSYAPAHARFSTPPIYGRDDRIEIKDAAPEVQAQASAVLALIPGDRWESTDLSSSGTAVLQALTLQTHQVCVNEPFATQQSSATCTGFLIAPDLLMTAAHCQLNPNACDAGARWVTDYREDLLLNVDGKKALATESLYECQKIEAWEFNLGDGTDFAILRLNRPVLGRTPLTLSLSNPAQKGTKVHLIGYPLGLPAKAALHGEIRKVLKRESGFATDLDAFQGNSGSPVINSETGLVEGVLSRGCPDFEWDARAGCGRASVLSSSSACERAYRVQTHAVKSALKRLGL